MKTANTMALCSVEEVRELYNQVLKLNNPIVVELGSYCGYSSYVLAQAVKEKNGRLFCVDAFIPEFDGQPHTGNLALESWNKTMVDYMDVTTLIISKTTEVDMNFPEGIDFLFIDADHSYQGFKDDLLTWSVLLKSGGLLALHDFNNLEFPGIKQAFDEFSQDTWEEISNTWSMRIYRKP